MPANRTELNSIAIENSKTASLVQSKCTFYESSSATGALVAPFVNSQGAILADGFWCVELLLKLDLCEACTFQIDY